MVEMKVYHCTNAEDNPMPVWMQMKPHQQKMPEKNEMDIVEQFKQNPDAFFGFYESKSLKIKQLPIGQLFY
ncbi:MAG: hypothetical protein ACLRX7_00965 [Acutalibacteraceae bacterium]